MGKGKFIAGGIIGIVLIIFVTVFIIFFLFNKPEVIVEETPLWKKQTTINCVNEHIHDLNNVNDGQNFKLTGEVFFDGSNSFYFRGEGFVHPIVNFNLADGTCTGADKIIGGEDNYFSVKNRISNFEGYVELIASLESSKERIKSWRPSLLFSIFG